MRACRASPVITPHFVPRSLLSLAPARRLHIGSMAGICSRSSRDSPIYQNPVLETACVQLGFHPGMVPGAKVVLGIGPIRRVVFFPGAAEGFLGQGVIFQG